MKALKLYLVLGSSKYIKVRISIDESIGYIYCKIITFPSQSRLFSPIESGIGPAMNGNLKLKNCTSYGGNGKSPSRQRSTLSRNSFETGPRLSSCSANNCSIKECQVL